MSDNIGKVFGGRYEVREIIGTGGMATKLKAASIATEAGIDMIIANGAHPEQLYDIMDGKSIGTRFFGREKN